MNEDKSVSEVVVSVQVEDDNNLITCSVAQWRRIVFAVAPIVGLHVTPSVLSPVSEGSFTITSHRET